MIAKGRFRCLEHSGDLIGMLTIKQGYQTLLVLSNTSKVLVDHLEYFYADFESAHYEQLLKEMCASPLATGEAEEYLYFEDLFSSMIELMLHKYISMNKSAGCLNKVVKIGAIQENPINVGMFHIFNETVLFIEGDNQTAKVTVAYSADQVEGLILFNGYEHAKDYILELVKMTMIPRTSEAVPQIVEGAIARLLVSASVSFAKPIRNIRTEFVIGEKPWSKNYENN